MSTINRILAFGMNIKAALEKLCNSPTVQHVVNMSNKAYLQGEEYAREFIIRKLDLDSYIRKHGWAILLTSINQSQRDQLKIILSTKKDQ